MNRLVIFAIAIFLLPSLAAAAITLNSDQPVSNSVTPQFYKYDQTQVYWAVTAVRQDAVTDWDMSLYSDTNFTAPVAISSYVAGYVDFVVSDYNHSQMGWQGIRIDRYSGSSSCQVEYEDGMDIFIPPSNSGDLSWPANHIAHAWDVQLNSGQTYTFNLKTVSGTVDYGIALFQSNGAAYYAGRSSSAAISDNNGPGEDETFTFTAPNTDYYGFIVWANNSNVGTYQIDIRTLSEIVDDRPLYITASPQDRKFNQTNIYWAIAAIRPDAGVDWDIYLYDDTIFTIYSAFSAYGPGYVDFVVADYNHSPVGWNGIELSRYTGIGGCRVEYEDGTEYVVAPGTSPIQEWPARHVAHIWEIYLSSGETWSFALNSVSGNVDYGIALFQSNNSSFYSSRGHEAVLADNNGSAGSEIFSFTATQSDYYGFVVWANNDEEGTFTIDIQSVPVLISASPFHNITDPQKYKYEQGYVYWAATAIRPDFGSDWDITMYADTSFTTPVANSSIGGGLIDFVVSDYNHDPTGWQGIRINRYTGTSNCQIEYSGTSNFLPSGPSQFVWPNGGHVIAVWDKYLNAGQSLQVTATPSGGLDIGIALFVSNGSTYYAGRIAAAQLSDTNSYGESESIAFVASHSDYYGVVVWNNNGAPGTIDFDVSTGIDESDATVPAEYALAQNYPNPFNAQTTIKYSLPIQSTVAIEIFDLLGRKIETLQEGIMPAGNHQAIWNASGQMSGIYLYRIKAGDYSKTQEMILLK
jgi:hypothetical protein